MGKLSIANENHNIRNMIWNEKSLQTGMFVGIGEKLSSLDSDGDYTGNIYPPYVSLYVHNFKNKTSLILGTCKHYYP